MIGVVIILLGRIPYEVKIPKNKPRATHQRGERKHLLHEQGGKAVIRGGVDVCYSEGKIRDGGGQGSGKTESFVDGGEEGEVSGVPSGKDAASTPFRVHRNELRQAAGKEGSSFDGGGGRQFRFLDTADSRGSKGERIARNRALVLVSQPPKVPGFEREEFKTNTIHYTETHQGDIHGGGKAANSATLFD